MKKLICLVGLPKSGKTTYALSLGFPIASPESLRYILTDKAFFTKSDKLVFALLEIMIKSLFNSGHQTVILDTANLTRYRRSHWLSTTEWRTEFHVLNTPLEVCLERANNEKLKATILEMNNIFEEVDFLEGPVCIVD